MKYLYTSPLPQTAQPQEATTTGKDISTLGNVDLSSTVVEAIGSQAADITAEGEYRYGAKYATKLARELDELADASFSNLPLYGENVDEIARPGYYAIDEATVEPLHPNSRDVWTYNLSLTIEGSRAEHYRAVEISRDGRKNDFGNDQDVHVGVDAAAELVQWWDGDAATEDATPIETRTTAFGDVDIFDVEAAGVGDDPTLLYRPASYAQERELDVRLWDDYGRGDKLDADGVVQWVRAFSSEHDPRGELVLENGILRLHLTDSSISAEFWTGYGGGEYGSGDYGENSWEPVSLGDSDWAPVDVDIRHIAPARVAARIHFSDGSSRYPLDCILARGADKVLIVRTPNASEDTPPGLIDLLDPIAATTTYDAQESQALVARTEVAE